MEYRIDNFGNKHFIREELGRGGQGVVYLTKDGDVLIKEALKNGSIITDEKDIKIFHKKVNSIIFKPIPHTIEIARPIAVLKDRAGYVMKMLKEMNEIKMLFPTQVSTELLKDIKVKEFLQEISDENLKKIFSYYFQTGSVRKRLKILVKIASILYKLHLRGLVYFDISYSNIFFNYEDEIVYFIDIDNLKYNSSIKLRDSIMTPDFETPEVANGNEPNSFYSDIYSFGILTYYLLTIQHPFKGDYENELDEEDAWDSDEKNNVDNNIKQWNLPWIEDKNDTSNQTQQGLRGKLTITEELQKLFHILFEDGKNDKYKRPSLNLWIKILTKAYYNTLECPNCKATYYDEYFDKCPYCDSKKPRRIVINSFFYKNETKIIDNSFNFVKEIKENEDIFLPKFLFKEFGLENYAKLKFYRKRVEFHFENRDKDEILFNKKTKIFNPRQRIGIEKLKKGIFIIVKSDIIKYLDVRVTE